MIKRSIPWVSQPQYPVALNPDYASYISSARLWSLAPGAPQEVARNNLGGYAKTGTIDVVPSIGGVGVKGDGSTGLFSRTVSVVPQAMWMAAQFVCSSVSALQKVAYALGSNAASTGAYCAISSGDSVSSNLVFQLRAIDSSVAIGKSGPVPVVGTTYTCIAVFPSNLKADAYVYVNGVKYTTDFTGSSDITFVGANTLVNEAVGALKRGTTAVYGSDTVLFTARGVGQIPEALARAISLNPYILLQPQQRNIYVGGNGSPTASQIESGTAVETSSIASATTAAITESGTALETASVAAATTANIIETGTAVETTSADIGALSSSQVESGTAVETSSAVVATTAAQAETGAAVETSSVTFATSSEIAETGLAVETSSATIAGQTITATTLVITKITGTFAAGSIKVGATTVGTCTGAQTINGASTALLRAQYTNLAADVYRALITTVPGSGSILGIWMYNDVKYAFRNVADGLSAAMYKSTTSGWSLVALGRELSYTSGGTYTIAVGDTITGEASAATAVITAITVESGTLAAGTAAGRIIFASQTGTFQAETIKVGANLNVANISGNSTAITFAVPGGRFEFVNYNFGSGSKMYGVDGKNRGFEFDGTTFVPISTGMVADTPSFVKGHKSHLFYAFAGSLQHSGIGTPYTWSIVSGAAELAMGDTITGMQLQAGAAASATMTVFTRNNIKTLYGSSSSDWNLSSYKEEAGAYRYTNQQVGGTYMLDDRGITSLVTSQNFGNFEDATLTKKIQSWINARRSMSIASCIARDKNQYRLFFTDGSALFVTIDNGNPIGMMPILLTHPVTCICSLENSSGNEEIYFGSTNGYVYQMDIGTSMDGGDIEFYMNLAFNHLKSPRVLKSFKTAVLEVSGEGYGEFSLGYDLSYLSTEVVQPPTQATTLSLNSISYDSGATYDSGAVYDGVNLTPSVFPLGGDGENISLKILGSSDYGNPLRFSGALVDFIVRRRLR